MWVCRPVVPITETSGKKTMALRIPWIFQLREFLARRIRDNTSIPSTVYRISSVMRYKSQGILYGYLRSLPVSSTLIKWSWVNLGKVGWILLMMIDSELTRNVVELAR